MQGAEIQDRPLVVSSSADPRLLSVLADAWPGVVWQVRPVSVLPILQTGHQPIGTLGVDRWLSWLGFAPEADSEGQEARGPLLVVSAGTATVCDLLHREGRQLVHLRGAILPGLRLMVESLSRQTASLSPYLEGGVSGLDWPAVRGPESSRAALHRGLAAAQVGALFWLSGLSDASGGQAKGQRAEVHVGGGDAEAWASALLELPANPESQPHWTVWRESLVLRGLDRLMREAGPNEARWPQWGLVKLTR